MLLGTFNLADRSRLSSLAMIFDVDVVMETVTRLEDLGY